MRSIGKQLGSVKSDVVASDSYYKRELDKLKSGGLYVNTVQVLDSEGNKTKWLSLNVECIDELIYYLQVLREGVMKGE